MTIHEQGSNADRRTRRQVRSILVMLALVALIVAAFVTAAPWLRATIGAPMTGLVSLALVILVVGGGQYFAFRHNRGLDEVQKASEGFAVRWGATVGQMVFIPLLILPPFQDFATSIVNRFAADPGTIVDDRAVVFAMCLGFGSLVLLQALGTVVFGIIWWTRSQR